MGKFESSLRSPYGITTSTLTSCRAKIEKQRNWLESQVFVTKHGEFKTFLDFTYSPNLGMRYYSRLQNKVNSMVAKAEEDGLKPVFLTVTLDGFFRDVLRGDYDRYGDSRKKAYRNKIPNNERYGFLRDKMENQIPLTVNDLYKVLNFQFRQFLSTRTMRAISKDEGYSFISAYEPHKKDGVPHLHCLLYVPERAVPKLYKDYRRIFPAPRNHKRVTLRDGGRVGELVYTNGRVKRYETHGFQTKIISPVGYIMKYVLKSMNDKKKQRKIDRLQAWYIENRVPRFVTSRTLVPQWVQHHAHCFQWSWLDLTRLREIGKLHHDASLNRFIIEDEGKRTAYYNGRYCISSVRDGTVLYEWGEEKEVMSMDRERCKKFWRSKGRGRLDKTLEARNVLIEIDDKRFEYNLDTGQLLKLGVKNIRSYGGYNRISDQQLLYDYQNFDIEHGNLQRYASIKRELVSRCLIEYEEVNINDYSWGNMIAFFDI